MIAIDNYIKWQSVAEIIFKTQQAIDLKVVRQEKKMIKKFKTLHWV